MSDKKLPIYMKPEDWTKAYEKNIPHWAEDKQPSRLAVQFLKMLRKKSGNKILEIGVGNGRDSIFFASKDNEVVGIDIVENAIKMARKNAETIGLGEGINFRVGNAEKLEFGNNSFNGIYSVSVLHATDLNKSLKEISRVLKLGGKSMIYLYEKTEEAGKQYWFMKKENLDKLLSKNHFLIINCRKIVHIGHEKEKTTVLIYKLKKS